MNGELNINLILERRKLSLQDTGKQFKNKEKKLPLEVLIRMIELFNNNFLKMTHKNILFAKNF